MDDVRAIKLLISYAKQLASDQSIPSAVRQELGTRAQRADRALKNLDSDIDSLEAKLRQSKRTKES